MKIHSAEWFKSKINQTKERVDQQWSPLMRSNAVYAAATLPQVVVGPSPTSKKPVESLHGLIEGKLLCGD